MVIQSIKHNNINITTLLLSLERRTSVWRMLYTAPARWTLDGYKEYQTQQHEHTYHFTIIRETNLSVMNVIYRASAVIWRIRQHHINITAILTEYVEPDALKEWKLSIFKIVDQCIKFYSQNTNLLPPKPKSTFRCSVRSWSPWVIEVFRF